MKREEIFEKLKTILVDKLGIDDCDVNEQAKVGDDLGADSLDAVELIMEVEREFGIYVPDKELDTWLDNDKSVGECVDYIKKVLRRL